MTAIAVLGTGNIGVTLAGKWTAAGHQVTLASRNPDAPALRDLAASIGARTATHADAVRDAEVVVVALPGDAVAAMAAALGDAIDGNVVIDATNNLGPAEMNSIATIVRHAPGAVCARAFNSLGWDVARLLAVTPSHFVGWWKYFDDLMRGPSGLSKTQREMIAVVISAESHCPYCETAHAAALRLRTKDPALVDRLAVNYRHVELDSRDRVMLDFAVKLTKTPEECEGRDLAHLRGVGYTDEDILHIVEVTAIFNYNVRLATATGLFPNVEYHELGRTQTD